MEPCDGFIPAVDLTVQYRDFKVEQYPPEVGAGLHAFLYQIFPGQKDGHVDALFQIGSDDVFILHVLLRYHEDDRFIVIVLQEAVERPGLPDLPDTLDIGEAPEVLEKFMVPLGQ